MGDSSENAPKNTAPHDWNPAMLNAMCENGYREIFYTRQVLAGKTLKNMISIVRSK